MNILHLLRGQAPRPLQTLECMPEDGFVWIDFTRDRAQDWETWPRRLLGVTVDRRHVIDSHDQAHKSFFDVTPDYDFLIFEEVGARELQLPLQARSVAFFMFERLLVTVRAAEAFSFALLQQRFDEGAVRAPANVRVLAQIVLDIVVDELLAAQESFSQRMDDFQEQLLEPNNPFKDWQQLLAGRREARRIEYLCEAQVKAMERWHRSQRFAWSNPEETRLHDLTEHITRVRHAAAELERHIEAAVQLYFASTTYRTNEIVRTLTVFSAIFLPLTFLAGIYGMNFRQMPELTVSFGYPMLLLFMLLVAIALLLYFRRRGYF